MSNEKALAVFEDIKIRRVYYEKLETWYFTELDIISALIQQSVRKYWKVLKDLLGKEGRESVVKFNRLKLEATIVNKYTTDVADSEAFFRIIQFVPSPKMDPLKVCLGKAGYERMQNMTDLTRSLYRACEYWQQLGRSENFLQSAKSKKNLRGPADE